MTFRVSEDFKRGFDDLLGFGSGAGARISLDQPSGAATCSRRVFRGAEAARLSVILPAGPSDQGGAAAAIPASPHDLSL